jgi:hypothetical protein
VPQPRPPISLPQVGRTAVPERGIIAGMSGDPVVLEPVPAPERAQRLVSAAGSMPFLLAALDAPARLEDADDPFAEALRCWIAENDWSTTERPSGWRKLAADSNFILVGSGMPPRLVTVTFERAADATAWSYWNSAEGGGVAAWRDGVEASSWRVDPLEPPLPTSSRLRALVTERACASGQSAAGRVRVPELYIDERELVLTFYVTPLEGSQECPGNPETAVIVELGQAVDGRFVRDGSVPTPNECIPSA